MSEHFMRKLRAHQMEHQLIVVEILRVLLEAKAVSPDASLSIGDIAAAIGKPIGVVLQEFCSGSMGDRTMPVIPTAAHWPLSEHSRFFIARSFDEIKFYDAALLDMKSHLDMQIGFVYELYERGRLPEAGPDDQQPDEGSTR